MVTKLGTISVFLALFFIIFIIFILVNVYALHNVIDFQVMCDLTDYEPYYNCDRPLLFIVFDQRYPPEWDWKTNLWVEQKPEDENKFFGQAYWNQYILAEFNNGTDSIKFNMIVLGNTYDQKGIGKYDNEENLSPLTHEIKHIKCKCKWHPTSEDD